MAKKQAVARKVSAFRDSCGPVSFDAEVCPQRRDVVVAGPSSRLPTSLVARRFGVCGRVGQIDVGRGDPFDRDHHHPAFFRGQHGDDINTQDGPVSRVRDHRCGYEGCRVGEASNPGPVVTRQGSRSMRQLSVPRTDTQIDVSSDEQIVAGMSSQECGRAKRLSPTLGPLCQRHLRNVGGQSCEPQVVNQWAERERS